MSLISLILRYNITLRYVFGLLFMVEVNLYIEHVLLLNLRNLKSLTFTVIKIHLILQNVCHNHAV